MTRNFCTPLIRDNQIDVYVLQATTRCEITTMHFICSFKYLSSVHLFICVISFDCKFSTYVCQQQQQQYILQHYKIHAFGRGERGGIETTEIQFFLYSHNFIGLKRYIDVLCDTNQLNEINEARHTFRMNQKLFSHTLLTVQLPGSKCATWTRRSIHSVTFMFRPLLSPYTLQFIVFHISRL